MQGNGEVSFLSSKSAQRKGQGCSFGYKQWLTKLKNQTKSEREKNKNAKAAGKVTEIVFLFFRFHIQGVCDVQGMKAIFRRKKMYLGGGISLVNKASKPMARAHFDFCFSSAGSVLLVPHAPRRAGEPQCVYLTVGSHHAAGIVRWRLCVRRGL